MRKLLWMIGAIGLIAASWTLAPGLAASLGGATQTLAGGSSAVTTCDADGVSTLFVLTGNDVSGVTVSNVSSACASITLRLSLTNGTTTGSGSATVPAGGGSMTVTLTPVVPVAAPNVLQTEISVS